MMIGKRFQPGTIWENNIRFQRTLMSQIMYLPNLIGHGVMKSTQTPWILCVSPSSLGVYIVVNSSEQTGGMTFPMQVLCYMDVFVGWCCCCWCNYCSFLNLHWWPLTLKIQRVFEHKLFKICHSFIHLGRCNFKWRTDEIGQSFSCQLM